MTVLREPAEDNPVGPNGRPRGGSPAANVLARLTGNGCEPRSAGPGKWDSRCPVHKGSRHNLSITEKSDGTVLLHCHHIDDSGRNCQNAAILAELGLELKDLFVPTGAPRRPGAKAAPKPAPEVKPKRQRRGFDSPRDAAHFLKGALKAAPAAHWIYRDATGNAYAAVYRFDRGNGKTYRPVSLDRERETKPWVIEDPKGGWLPYRAEEIGAADRVFIVEGEKCVELVRGLGLVATTTAHGAQSPQKTDLSLLAGKELVIIPDAGPPGEGYTVKLIELLSKLEPLPSLKVLRLPDLTDGDDIEQWIQTNNGTSHAEIEAKLLRMADGCPLIENTTNTAETQVIRPNESPDDPSRLARLFLDERCRHPDGLTLRFFQGDYVEWDGAYRPVLAQDVRARLHPVIKAEFDRLNVEQIERWQRSQSVKAAFPPNALKVTGTLVSNTVLALSGYTRLEPRTIQPSWLTGPSPFPAEDVLPTRNALVHLPGLVGGSPDAIHPPTPRYFCPYALDYDFDPDAPQPYRWYEFLKSVWPDDSEAIDTLQEWFGYLLTPDTSHQKILMLIGPKRSGKGTVARIKKALIGADNVANPTFASLSTNFGLAPLIGKPAATITDARLSGRTDIAQVVERLLSISGEDSQTIDRKHMAAATVKLPTRFTLISNELPRLMDTSGALAGRLILLRMTRSFYGHEDQNLTATLLTELPGILLWAIKGWQRLRERGRFVQPESGKAMVEEMEDLASPVGAFLKDRCRIVAGGEVLTAELYQAWKGWCQEHGRDNPGDALVFGRNLRAVLPNLYTPSRRLADGTRKRSYEGIELLLEPPKPLDGY